MRLPQVIASSFWAASASCLLAITVSGCSPQESIRRYTVAKPALEDRMLAAIVPHEKRAWFFKLSGEEVAIGTHNKAFVEMVRSLKFDPSGKPSWTAPEDWRRKEDSGPQGLFSAHTTLEVDGEGGPYELTVTNLTLPPGNLTGYVLANVNRWRKQLGLRSISEDQLPNKSTQFDLDGAQVTIVNLLGNLPDDPAGPMSQPPPRAAVRPSPPPAAGESIKFDTPLGWSQGQLLVARGGITIRRQAAFAVKRDGKSVEITATRMPGNPASLLINVNRWRGQVKLDRVTEAKLAADGKKIDIDGATGTYVELIGAEESILGVVAFRNGMAWYIKLQGDRDLALQERTHFDEFLKSIRFE
jgi:hypothetical protein